jgi:DNA helicase II / ATP-dependent DNA helicase PcrA
MPASSRRSPTATPQGAVSDDLATSILSPKRRATISSADFFTLVDLVLDEVGRPPLGLEQRGIVEVRDEDQVLQIIAGPGSGKTEVLVWRVLFELFVRGKEASRLMVTTFTRKAAQELNVRMVDRSDGLLAVARAADVAVDDPRVHDLRIGTIHALCDQLLGEFDAEHLEQGTQLVDEAEIRVRQLREWGWLFRDKERGEHILKNVLAVPELDALFRAPWNERALFGMSQVDFTLLLLNQHTETWIPRCGSVGKPNGLESFGHPGLTDKLVWLQKRWEDYLDDNHVLDFATLQKRFLERQHVVAGQLDHVFVDEFQDTNPIQAAIHLGWIRAVGARLTVVGDDDQALYRFRGSDIACFANLERDCTDSGFAFRHKLLQDNRRSSANIVAFAQTFREATVLSTVSLAKEVRAPRGTLAGAPVRLLEGPWDQLCNQVANELDTFGAGRIADDGAEPSPSVAILMFSTSEVESRTNPKPAPELLAALEDRGLRVYNPRNKSAARPGSPVYDLFGLISYLIDPVSKAPAGVNGRLIEVWASMGDKEKAVYASTAPPGVWVAKDHAGIQKKVRKTHANRLDDPGPELGPLLAYLDRIRADLIAAAQRDKPIRLNLGGLVARLLRMEPFRSAGYTPRLFRQALFTQLLEANVAATRLTKRSLEKPPRPTLEGGKVVWPDEFWRLLSTFGQLVAAGGQDDVEVEAFADGAVAMLTFHQAKGLEFDHVYVAMTGKEPEPSAALATELFSGNCPSFTVVDKQPVSSDPQVTQLAEADREREIYVAITRPKQTLTVLHSPTDGRWAMDLNPGLARVFANAKRTRRGDITEIRWKR